MAKLRTIGMFVLASALLPPAVGCNTQSTLSKEEAANIKGHPMTAANRQQMADFQKQWAEKHAKPIAGPSGGAPPGAAPPGPPSAAGK